ncbi:uncharacterized protein CLAFUR5_14582 [Fulvia fulva]|uniref:PA14 domain-containing protein n=1 Tax=Passalora fulva TaxID=5499 RepID=A0A9Q8PLV4_PASFU|nr:uncharacterized protein CLAFUR5_14582 [Fulvia fulva]UJO24858.1 hypothetical protein CLAFUR5_14582 [Fulvia fulva]
MLSPLVSLTAVLSVLPVAFAGARDGTRQKRSVLRSDLTRRATSPNCPIAKTPPRRSGVRCAMRGTVAQAAIYASSEPFTSCSGDYKDCYYKCLADDYCLSFSFNDVTKQCQGYDTNVNTLGYRSSATSPTTLWDFDQCFASEQCDEDPYGTEPGACTIVTTSNAPTSTSTVAITTTTLDITTTTGQDTVTTTVASTGDAPSSSTDGTTSDASSSTTDASTSEVGSSSTTLDAPATTTTPATCKINDVRCNQSDECCSGFCDLPLLNRLGKRNLGTCRDPPTSTTTTELITTSEEPSSTTDASSTTDVVTSTTSDAPVFTTPAVCASEGGGCFISSDCCTGNCVPPSLIERNGDIPIIDIQGTCGPAITTTTSDVTSSTDTPSSTTLETTATTTAPAECTPQGDTCVLDSECCSGNCEPFEISGFDPIRKRASPNIGLGSCGPPLTTTTTADVTTTTAHVTSTSDAASSTTDSISSTTTAGPIQTCVSDSTNLLGPYDPQGLDYTVLDQTLYNDQANVYSANGALTEPVTGTGSGLNNMAWISANWPNGNNGVVTLPDSAGTQVDLATKSILARGWFVAPIMGTYTFTLNSGRNDNFARLWLGDNAVEPEEDNADAAVTFVFNSNTAVQATTKLLAAGEIYRFAYLWSNGGTQAQSYLLIRNAVTGDDNSVGNFIADCVSPPAVTTTTTAEASSTTDSVSSTTEEVTSSTTDTSSSTTDAPSSTTDSSTSDVPSSTTDAASSTTDSSTSDVPSSTTDAASSTTDSSTSDSPSSTTEGPSSTTEDSSSSTTDASTSDGSSSTSDIASSTTDVESTSQNPTTTTQEITTTQPPTTTTAQSTTATTTTTGRPNPGPGGNRAPYCNSDLSENNNAPGAGGCSSGCYCDNQFGTGNRVCDANPPADDPDFTCSTDSSCAAGSFCAAGFYQRYYGHPVCVKYTSCTSTYTFGGGRGNPSRRKRAEARQPPRADMVFADWNIRVANITGLGDLE